MKTLAARRSSYENKGVSSLPMSLGRFPISRAAGLESKRVGTADPRYTKKRLGNSLVPLELHPSLRAVHTWKRTQWTRCDGPQITGRHRRRAALSRKIEQRGPQQLRTTIAFVSTATDIHEGRVRHDNDGQLLQGRNPGTRRWLTDERELPQLDLSVGDRLTEIGRFQDQQL